MVRKDFPGTVIAVTERIRHHQTVGFTSAEQSGPDDGISISIWNTRGNLKAVARVDLSELRQALVLAGIGTSRAKGE